MRETLNLSQEDVEQRLALIYKNVTVSPWPVIALLLVVGVCGAITGGERVAEFAKIAIKGLGLNNILTALILAVFAGRIRHSLEVAP